MTRGAEVEQTVKRVLTVIGTRPEGIKLARVVRAPPPIVTTRLLGSVPNDAMPRLHSASDVAVLPSLLEATSIAGLETMACGVPLLGTAVGGIPEIVTDGVEGTLVPPRDPGALASALERMLVNADGRRAMGARARERVVHEFSWQAISRRSVAVYSVAAAEFANLHGRVASDGRIAGARDNVPAHRAGASIAGR